MPPAAPRGRPRRRAKSDRRACRCKSSPLSGTREKRHPRREAGSQSQGSHEDRPAAKRYAREPASRQRPAPRRAWIGACPRSPRRLDARRVLDLRARLRRRRLPRAGALRAVARRRRLDARSARCGARRGRRDPSQRAAQPPWMDAAAVRFAVVARRPAVLGCLRCDLLPALAESRRLLLARLRGAGGCRRPSALSPRPRLDQDLTARDRAADRRHLDAGDLAADGRPAQLATLRRGRGDLARLPDLLRLRRADHGSGRARAATGPETQRRHRRHARRPRADGGRLRLLGA